MKCCVQTITSPAAGLMSSTCSIIMLGLAKRTKARVFQAFTRDVYGDPQVHPQKDDYWDT
jgi:hypothetical protein